jgi:hypothetical protein
VQSRSSFGCQFVELRGGGDRCYLDVVSGLGFGLISIVSSSYGFVVASQPPRRTAASPDNVTEWVEWAPGHLTKWIP